MAEYILDTTDGIFNASTTGELIRCKDCKHFMTAGGKCVCMSLLVPCTPDDYCSFAEKREEKKEES